MHLYLSTTVPASITTSLPYLEELGDEDCFGGLPAKGSVVNDLFEKKLEK